MANQRESDSPNSEFANHSGVTIYALFVIRKFMAIHDNSRIVYSRLYSDIRFCFGIRFNHSYTHLLKIMWHLHVSYTRISLFLLHYSVWYFLVLRVLSWLSSMQFGILCLFSFFLCDDFFIQVAGLCDVEYALHGVLCRIMVNIMCHRMCFFENFLRNGRNAAHYTS